MGWKTKYVLAPLVGVLLPALLYGINAIQTFTNTGEFVDDAVVRATFAIPIFFVIFGIPLLVLGQLVFVVPLYNKLVEAYGNTAWVIASMSFLVSIVLGILSTEILWDGAIDGARDRRLFADLSIAMTLLWLMYLGPNISLLQRVTAKKDGAE